MAQSQMIAQVCRAIDSLMDYAGRGLGLDHCLHWTHMNRVPVRLAMTPLMHWWPDCMTPPLARDCLMSMQRHFPFFWTCSWVR